MQVGSKALPVQQQPERKITGSSLVQIQAPALCKQSSLDWRHVMSVANRRKADEGQLSRVSANMNRGVVWRVAKGIAMKDPEIVQRMGVVETR